MKEAIQQYLFFVFLSTLKLIKRCRYVSKQQAVSGNCITLNHIANTTDIINTDGLPSIVDGNAINANLVKETKTLTGAINNWAKAIETYENLN